MQHSHLEGEKKQDPQESLWKHIESKGFTPSKKAWDPEGYRYFDIETKSEPKMQGNKIVEKYAGEFLNPELNEKYQNNRFKKFHIGLSGHKEMNKLRELEFEAIINILAEYKVSFKVIDLINPEMTYQLGKDIAIYQFKNPHMSDADWLKMFDSINANLAKIRSENADLAVKYGFHLGTEITTPRHSERVDQARMGERVSYRWEAAPAKKQKLKLPRVLEVEDTPPAPSELVTTPRDKASTPSDAPSVASISDDGRPSPLQVTSHPSSVSAPADVDRARTPGRPPVLKLPIFNVESPTASPPSYASTVRAVGGVSAFSSGNKNVDKSDSSKDMKKNEEETAEHDKGSLPSPTKKS
ncbi:MAG: hypothetical protein ACYCQI_09175 [Gammaproteobacteria bacterium]